MCTGVVSVADESCATLTFGGLLAAFYCAKTIGVGQKVETSLVVSLVRLMGWTLTTTMWGDQDPITGARINGTPERLGIGASFNDIDGKPLVFQLMPKDWKPALKALDFQSTLDARGLSELGQHWSRKNIKTACWRRWLNCWPKANLPTG
ncbi:MAG: crotonobetainyl-CoA:carnitine CoA-transferase CaiB-like acyl-CoA transferase [Gammaproteobacteria bacterium]|jgi:crotonobetainyl-CoA:carnitine CoA-transferase CaiB-like acyl-CoA transferase